MLLLQVFGVDIQLKAAFLHSLQNGLPGLFADIGVVIEDTGDGGNTIAGLFCKVFDGHKYLFLVENGSAINPSLHRLPHP